MATKPPSFKVTAFDCPHCNAYAHMEWEVLYAQATRAGWRPSSYIQSTCTHCREAACWIGLTKSDEGRWLTARMVEPLTQVAPHPHPDMPAAVKIDFEEARRIQCDSPRAAAALLRLCIQKLCKHLGESGTNINADIGSLVRKGLPVEVQQSLDVVRVIGNNAVHPGEISPEDVASVSNSLFELVNYIVEDRIARPEKLKMLFNALPEPALAGIQARDKGGAK